MINFKDWRFPSFEAYCSDKSSRLSRKLGLEWFGGISEFLTIQDNITEIYLPEHC